MSKYYTAHFIFKNLARAKRFLFLIAKNITIPELYFVRTSNLSIFWKSSHPGGIHEIANNSLFQKKVTKGCNRCLAFRYIASNIRYNLLIQNMTLFHLHGHNFKSNTDLHVWRGTEIKSIKRIPLICMSHVALSNTYFYFHCRLEMIQKTETL